MDTKLNILFYVGIIVPTTITVGFFIGFLVCWFQCNLRDRLLDFKSKKQKKASSNTEQNGEHIESTDKASQHSADSAIDVNELELTASDEKEKHASDRSKSSVPPVAPSQHLPDATDGRPGLLATMHFLTEADIQSNISRGMYPSHEKLNEEIHSEPRIYETPEDLEIAMYNGLAPAFQYSDSISTQSNYKAAQQMRQTSYNCAARLLTVRRTSYSGSLGKVQDNHATDYGFAPWQRPNSVCSPGRSTQKPVFSLPKYKTNNISWNKGVIEDSTNYPLEILHV